MPNEKTTDASGPYKVECVRFTTGGHQYQIHGLGNKFGCIDGTSAKTGCKRLNDSYAAGHAAALTRNAEPSEAYRAMQIALQRIACDWCGIGSCPHCGIDHGMVFPATTEDWMRAVARDALSHAERQEGSK